jgi:hypothetical protein
MATRAQLDKLAQRIEALASRPRHGGRIVMIIVDEESEESARSAIVLRIPKTARRLKSSSCTSSIPRLQWASLQRSVEGDGLSRTDHPP